MNILEIYFEDLATAHHASVKDEQTVIFSSISTRFTIRQWAKHY